MGGEPYWYFVPYDPDAQRALDALRQQEFETGRYNPVLRHIEFREPARSRQQPGASHATIAEAVRDAAQEGTRSILDITRIGTEGYGVAVRLEDDVVRDYCHTGKPTRADINAHMSIVFEDIDRGDCVYTVVYDAHGEPSELFFAGYSYD